MLGAQGVDNARHKQGADRAGADSLSVVNCQASVVRCVLHRRRQLTTDNGQLTAGPPSPQIFTSRERPMRRGTWMALAIIGALWSATAGASICFPHPPV